MNKKMKKILFIALSIFLLFAFSKIRKPTPYPFVDLKFFPKMPVSADNIVSIEGAELGKFLFYDSILSQNYDMSCASCHKQEKAFSDSPNKFSIGHQKNLHVEILCHFLI